MREHKRGRIKGRLNIDAHARRLIDNLNRGRDDDCFDRPALACELGVSTSWLESPAILCPDGGIKFFKTGGLAVYRRGDVIAWLRRRAEIFEENHRSAGRREAVVIIRGVRA